MRADVFQPARQDDLELLLAGRHVAVRQHIAVGREDDARTLARGLPVLAKRGDARDGRTDDVIGVRNARRIGIELELLGVGKGGHAD